MHSSESGSAADAHKLCRRDSGCQTETDGLSNGLNSSLKIKDSNLDTVSENKTSNNNPVKTEVGTVSEGTDVQSAEPEVLY